MEYNNKNVFIELTNPVHGGEGWDFGEVLWSPSKDLSGKDTWRIMRQVNPGDIIIHSIKRNGKLHQFTGVSIAKSAYKEVSTEPPIPGRWAGYQSYYRIQLQSYSPFKNPLFIKDFLVKYKSQLLALGEIHSFYDKECNNTVQKYMAVIPKALFNLLLDFFQNNQNGLFNDIVVANDDDIINAEDNASNPPRILTTITRVVRDTKLIIKLKQEYNDVCQICGSRIQLPNGKGYSEGHHLQKLGGIHEGPDIKENIIILCPYHHAEFDYGIIGIDKNNMIVHIDPSNQLNGKQLFYNRKNLGSKYLSYHIRHIYNK